MKQGRKQKTSDVKEKRLPIKKTKQTTFIVSFIKILYGFLGFLEKVKQKEGKFIVQKQDNQQLVYEQKHKKTGRIDLKKYRKRHEKH